MDIPPNDINVECNAIQKFLSTNNIKRLKTWSNILDEDDLFNDSCRRALSGIRVCLNKDRIPDVGTLLSTGFITQTELQPILGASVSKANMKQHIALLKEHSIKRAIIKEAFEIQGIMNATTNPREEAMAFITKINDISKSKTTGDLLSTKETIRDTLKMFKAGVDGDNKLRVMFHTSIMDECLIAYRKEVVVIGANSGVGKTSLGLSCIFNQLQAGLHVVYFCNESDKKKLMAKLMCQHVECAFTDLLLKLDTLSNDQKNRLKEISEILELHADNFHIYGAGDYEHSVSGISLKTQDILDQYGEIDMVYVDYLQDMKQPALCKGNETESIASNIQGIKDAIQSIDCACVVMCQINRDTKNNDNKMPEMTNLKGSSKIENIASLIIFLHRNIKPDDWKKEVLKTLMYTPKARDQQNINKSIAFRGRCTRFERWDDLMEHRYQESFNPPKKGIRK